MVGAQGAIGRAGIWASRRRLCRGEAIRHNHLVQWTSEEWGTRSGEESLKTGERYLPREAREALTDEEYRRTTQKKRVDLSKGRQFSR